ncbi:MAG: DUF2726 domain-containing protein [Moraxellaceae bacterium]|nr:MAG: DUF2726 domain-containing protein [Moraxellaceae bacterium]
MGYLLYRFDKKFKSKYNDDRSPPKSWDVPLAIEAAEDTKFATAARAGDPIIYFKSPSLFSPAEKIFLGALTQALADNYRIFAKVRVSDVINIKPNSSKSVWQIAFNKLSASYFDFVICNKDNLGVLCAVELDDKSTQKDDPVDRDKVLEHICEAAKLPLVRFDVRDFYDSQSVRKHVLQSLGINDIPLQQNYALEITPIEGQPRAASITGEQPVLKLCPKCTAVMVKRTAKSGAHEGKLFWACSTYPRCKGIEQIA